jgi:hypothetical protein
MVIKHKYLLIESEDNYFISKKLHIRSKHTAHMVSLCTGPASALQPRYSCSPLRSSYLTAQPRPLTLFLTNWESPAQCKCRLWALCFLHLGSRETVRNSSTKRIMCPFVCLLETSLLQWCLTSCIHYSDILNSEPPCYWGLRLKFGQTCVLGRPHPPMSL